VGENQWNRHPDFNDQKIDVSENEGLHLLYDRECFLNCFGEKIWVNIGHDDNPWDFGGALFSKTPTNVTLNV
jgi:hypothetical protein